MQLVVRSWSRVEIASDLEKEIIVIGSRQDNDVVVLILPSRRNIVAFCGKRKTW